MQHNIRGSLRECAPVLGAWHAYAQALKKVYEDFLPWFAALEIPGFLQYPEQAVVWTKPKVITLEHLAMGVFLACPLVEADIRRTLDDVKHMDNPGKRVEQCEGLLVLVTEYCPALVQLGIEVRQCFWGSQELGSGAEARVVLRDALMLLRSLRADPRSEYIRNLALMDVLWSQLHSALPAAAFVEECLESSLSVLTRRAATDTRAHTLEQFSDMYTQGDTQLAMDGSFLSKFSCMAPVGRQKFHDGSS